MNILVLICYVWIPSPDSQEECTLVETDAASLEVYCERAEEIASWWTTTDGYIEITKCVEQKDDELQNDIT